ncbi:hypothetical protein ACM66B_004012 [Microbotryomycetes sp. NB124-2]
MSDSKSVAGSSKDLDGAPHETVKPEDHDDHNTLRGPASAEEINKFLDTYKPSSRNDDLPWIWVRIPGRKKAEMSVKDDEPAADDEVKDDSFAAAGEKLVKALTEECERIKNEAPVRANKAKGLRSQKDLREEEHAKFNNAVAELAQKHGLTSGKWLLYPGEDSVDSTWAKVVNAIATEDGALAKTGHVHFAKAATAPTPTKGDAPPIWVICVYCDNSFDKEAVGTVFRTLVNDLGLVSSAYKTDANTILGIDSNHPSKIKSSLYGKSDFMSKEEIDEAMAARSKARAVKSSTKTAEEEQEDGGAGFAPLSDSSDDEKPPVKKAKK